MTISPRLLRAGLVLVDAEAGTVQRIVALQYNPDALTRSLQPQGLGGDGGERSEALRLKGPAIETIKLDAELDATDEMAAGEGAGGLHGALASLELLIHPSVASLRANQSLADAGTLEIVPVEQPLLLFVWGRNRVIPVRITEFSVAEEAFDPSLNPLRAKVSLSLRVLSASDFPAGHRGANLYLAHLSQKEQLARRRPATRLDALGLSSIGA